MSLVALGNSKVREPSELLESFQKPSHVNRVVMVSDEVTALCPVTGMPDQYTVENDYFPDGLCIESKSLKLKLQSFRQVGVFCEQLSTDIAQHVMDSISPFAVEVLVTQKSRGGVVIKAHSSLSRNQ